MKVRFLAVILILLGGLIGYFTYSSEINPESKFPFKLGLDLAGGTHLVYNADISNLESSEVSGSMDALRDVIERRTNLFGVSEPLVQVEKSGDSNRLIVELPGVTDINQAVTMIGETPMLEFKKERPGTETQDILRAQQEFIASGQTEISPNSNPLVFQDPYEETGLTGSYLEKAQLIFSPNTGEPVVLLTFNAEGKKMFADITKNNINKVLAIYLDGVPITDPVVRDEIKDGKAEISGGFTPEEAKTLVRDLNYGALPVPIELISTQSVGASLGEDVAHKGVYAGIFGLLAVIIFLLAWYRLPGLIAVFALSFYVAVMLALFKLVPVTLTSAGIAGFILSIRKSLSYSITPLVRCSMIISIFSCTSFMSFVSLLSTICSCEMLPSFLFILLSAERLIISSISNCTPTASSDNSFSFSGMCRRSEKSPTATFFKTLLMFINVALVLFLCSPEKVELDEIFWLSIYKYEEKILH